MNRRDPGFDVWVVVADVLIGFLCVIFFLFVGQVSPGAQLPPESVSKFEWEIKEHMVRSGGKFEVGSEFSKVRLRYGEKLLFRTCEWSLSERGRALMREHFDILRRHMEFISRIQIEGHADSRPAERCVSLQQAGLRRDNWILSSLRALEVRDFLEEIIRKSQGNTLVDNLKKIEAVGRGHLHPVNSRDLASELNRRIEITVHFIEKAAAPQSAPTSAGYAMANRSSPGTGPSKP